MNQSDAEGKMVQYGGRGCYLTRYSQDNGAYFLSVMGREENGKPNFEHLRITIAQKNSEENTYTLEGKTSSTFSEMLQHYQHIDAVELK